jgi:hypothetical protein
VMNIRHEKGRRTKGSIGESNKAISFDHIYQISEMEGKDEAYFSTRPQWPRSPSGFG